MANRNNGEGTFSIEDLPPCKGGVSRRGFCVSAGAGLITLGLAACDPGGGRVEIGGLGTDDGGSNNNGGGQDGGTGGGKDGGSGGTGDMAHSGNPDLANSGGTCSGPLNAGPASAITTGQAKHFSSGFSYNLFVCRDANGLYAMDAACTHSGCTLTKQTSQFFCNCHGATFDLNGQHPTSPAFSPLDHYSLCVDGSGNILVDYNKTVSATTRA